MDSMTLINLALNPGALRSHIKGLVIGANVTSDELQECFKRVRERPPISVRLRKTRKHNSKE